MGQRRGWPDAHRVEGPVVVVRARAFTLVGVSWLFAALGGCSSPARPAASALHFAPPIQQFVAPQPLAIEAPRRGCSSAA
jgi:hypothetical protein